jgi:hypothetical protein
MNAVLGPDTATVATMADLARMPFLDAVLKESLRVTPPAPMTLRLAGEDQTVCGLAVPKGTWLQVDTVAVQTDPAVWGPDAADFRPERWFTADDKARAVGFNAFGAGTLSCVGARFAETEAKLTLIALLRRFAFEPAGPEWVDGRVDLDLETRLTMGPRHGVWVRPRLLEAEGGCLPPPRTPTGVLGGPPPSLDGDSVGTASDEESVVVGKAGAGVSGGGGGGSGLRARIVVG